VIISFLFNIGKQQEVTMIHCVIICFLLENIHFQLTCGRTMMEYALQYALQEKMPKAFKLVAIVKFTISNYI